MPKPSLDTKGRFSKRLYSLEEAGYYLGRSEWVIAKMVRKGELPYVGHGRRKLLDIKDLDLWVDREKIRDVV